jgi:tetratricopeptide (TPR) repeat protein
MMDALQADRINVISAIDLAADSGYDEHAIWLPYLSGYFLDLAGYSVDAERVHEVAIVVAVRSGDDLMRANLMSNLAAIQYSTGRFDAALASADGAVPVFERLGDPKAVGRALNNAGNALYRMGRYAAALDRYQRALGLIPDEQDATAATLLVNLAIIELRLDRVAAAREHADRALGVDGPSNNRNRVNVLDVIGNINRRIGDYPAAERAYVEASRLSRERGDGTMEASISNNRGILERLRGRYAAAATRHVHALRLDRHRGQISAEAETGNDLGITLRMAGHPLLAAAAHRAALGPAARSSNRYEQARAHEGIAAAIGASDRAAALAHAEQARALFVEMGLPDARRIATLIDNQLAHQF